MRFRSRASVPDEVVVSVPDRVSVPEPVVEVVVLSVVVSPPVVWVELVPPSATFVDPDVVSLVVPVTVESTVVSWSPRVSADQVFALHLLNVILYYLLV